MEAPEDNSITMVASHSQAYTDNNLNGKSASTHYIFTADGELIPTMSEPVTQSMDINNTQHFDTAHLTDVQGIHIHQVDFQQYEQQYTDNNAVQATPIVGQFVESQPQTTFVMDQTNYIPQNPQENVMETSQTSVFDTSLVADTQTTNSYNFDTQVTGYIEPAAETASQLVMNFNAKLDDNEIETAAAAAASQPEAVVNQTNENVDQTSVEEQQADSAVNDAKEIMETSDEIESSSKPTQEIVSHETESVKEHETDAGTKQIEQAQQATEEAASAVEAKISEAVESEQKDDLLSATCAASTTSAIEKGSSSANESTETAAEEENTNNQENHIEYISEGSEVDGDPNALQIEEEHQDVSKLVGKKKSEEGQGAGHRKQIIQQDSSMEIEEISFDKTDNSNTQGEELLIVYDDENAPEATEQKATYTIKISGRTNNKPEMDIVRQRPQRGRRPKTEIPLHILGHDINKPVDNVVNGKSPKPRLGVKVPYRNLTSQIVSKQDIEKEILERGKKKHEKEILFARQLTARLAKKLSSKGNTVATATTSTKENPTASEQPAPTSSAVKDVEQEMRSIDSSSQSTNSEDEDTPKEKTSTPIENNSDLLAILEGNDDNDHDATEEPKSKQASSKVETEPSTDSKKKIPNDKKNMERMIALKQLQDLPYISPSTRFYLGRTCKSYMKELPSSLVDGASSDSGNYSLKEKSFNKGSKTNEPKRFTEIEPSIKVKVNTALKTYSRKRKSGEGTAEYLPEKKPPPAEILDADELELKSQGINTPGRNVYMTKSSRIIKKKVIWDPDEPSTRSTAVLLKTPVSKPIDSPQRTVTKPSPKTETKQTAEMAKKSVEKVAEKKIEAKVIKIEKKTESPVKKPAVAQPPVAEKKITPPKVKKIKTEVDKLLGDEGAIKMLYDLKNTDEAHDRKRKNVISVERTFKDLAKKANLIKSDLVSTSSVESPKSLRKKESAASSSAGSSKSATPVAAEITRQMSKDSNGSPPASPSFQCSHETSYLIRRRSSSSISSEEETAQSMEIEDDTENILRKITADSSMKVKKVTKPVDNKEQINDSDVKAQKKAELRIGQYNTFSVKKSNKSVYIDLHTQVVTQCYFTSELLEELTTALNKISKEKDCNVVLIRSKNEKYFSLGLDYKTLVSDKENERKEKANSLADIVSDFIKCLLHFPKILVAGIQGECCGLAVTMLPLFDIVIASDNASFSTTYSTLGTIAEAGFLLTVPYVTHHGVASDLFFVAQKLTADEAFRRGLISRLCWPEKYQDTIKSVMSSIVKGSRQSLDSTKKQLRSNIISLTEDALEVMTNQLVHHWTSSECQKNFAKLE